MLADIDSSLPNIPPEEEKYLAAESAATDKLYQIESVKKISHSVTNARFHKLENRRLYFVWNVKLDLKKVIAAVDFILCDHDSAYKLWLDGNAPSNWSPIKIYENPEATKLERAAGSLYSISNLQMSLREFLIREEAHGADPLLSSEQYNKLQGQHLAPMTDMAFYIKCKLAKAAQAF